LVGLIWFVGLICLIRLIWSVWLVGMGFVV